MKLMRLGLASTALLALAAVLSSSAFATPVTKKSSWLAGSTRLTAATNFACSKRGASNFVLKGTVLGAETEVVATGVECFVNPSISNTVVEGTNMAVGNERFDFAAVSIVKPAGCSTEFHLMTETLKNRLEMDTSVSGRSFLSFEPTGEKISSLKISGCAIAGTYPIKGATYGRMVNATGTSAFVQPIVFDSETNGFSALTLAGKPATLTGELNIEFFTSSPIQAKEE
jgi:hypothetical protein